MEVNRRDFLKAAGAVTLGTAATTLLPKTANTQTSGPKYHELPLDYSYYYGQSCLGALDVYKEEVADILSKWSKMATAKESKKPMKDDILKLVDIWNSNNLDRELSLITIPRLSIQIGPNNEVVYFSETMTQGGIRKLNDIYFSFCELPLAARKDLEGVIQIAQRRGSEWGMYGDTLREAIKFNEDEFCAAIKEITGDQDPISKKRKNWGEVTDFISFPVRYNKNPTAVDNYGNPEKTEIISVYYWEVKKKLPSLCNTKLAATEAEASKLVRSLQKYIDSFMIEGTKAFDVLGAKYGTDDADINILGMPLEYIPPSVVSGRNVTDPKQYAKSHLNAIKGFIKTV